MQMDYRYIAQLVVEAATPLAVASGDTDLMTVSPVCVDANGLPAINGTSIAGVLRHQFAWLRQDAVSEIFGYQDFENAEQSHGSRMIVSNAHLVDDQGNAVEGLLAPQQLQSEYFRQLQVLPLRQHCRIDHRGVADSKQHGKYDQQVVPKGVRFKLEIELVGSAADDQVWHELLAIFSHPAFRIGGGTRKGFGKLKILPDLCQVKVFKLGQKGDLDDYLAKSSSLNARFGGASLKVSVNSDANWRGYHLQLQPENLWMFGSGLPDQEADITPVYESIVVWDSGQPRLSERQILVPATAVKGAIAHRVAYHYNRLQGQWADKEADIEQHIRENNRAVRELFGYAKDSNHKQSRGHIGNVIFSDVFIHDNNCRQRLNHVSLDRFTGGARDTALFNESVIAQNSKLGMELWVHQRAFDADAKVQPAFEAALQDICTGMLPLGGGVMRGHGVFIGTWRQLEGK